MAESDDVAEPKLLEKLVDSIQGAESAMAYCQSVGIDKNSNVISEIKGWTDCYSRHLWSQDFSMDGNFFCIQYMAIKCVIPNASAVLFRRDYYISPVTRHLVFVWLVIGCYGFASCCSAGSPSSLSH